MPSLGESLDLLIKRISALIRTADDTSLTDGEYMAVDKADGYTRKITVASLAAWVHNKWASFVNGKPAATEFKENDVVSVSNPADGVRKMGYTALQNAILGGVGCGCCAGLARRAS